MPLSAGDTSLFVFVLEGKVRVSQCGGESHILEAGLFFFKPVTVYYEMCALEHGARVMTCSFHFYASEGIRHFLRQLELADTTASPQGHVIFKTLSIKEDFRIFLDDIARRLPDSPFPERYYQLKLDELFMFLEAYYDRNDLSMMFSSMLGRNLDFMNEVISCYLASMTLSQMAEHFKMERVTFNRHFMASFGMTASKWLRNMRNIEILRMIRTTDLNFSEIAFRLGLSSSAYLTEYCRKCWGKTPTMLRMEP